MSTLMTVAMSVVMFAAQRSFPPDVQGLREWGGGMLTLVVSSALFALRGLVMPEILLPLANTVFLWGMGRVLIGTQKFYGVRPNWRLFHAVWLLGLLVMVVWLHWRPDFAMRVALMSFLVLVLNLAQLLVIVRHGERHLSTTFFATLSLLQVLSVLHRGVTALQGGAGVDLVQGGRYHDLYLTVMAFLTLLLPVGFMTVATRRLQLLLEQRSNLDPLTSVLNRRGFADAHARESARLQRSGLPLAVMSIDLDFFKAINDAHGHAVGDLVLVDVAGVITAALRAGDFVARFGGEEFVVLLPDTDMERATLIAQRIRQVLHQPRPSDAMDLPRYTVSIGIASQHGSGEPLDAMLLRSDRALYRAKQAGRDRIETDESHPEVA
ncbi:GGDEF domain-containing protein [Janthinobacterium sp.]|uniref:GGDEF domain-containing protein n=1 Tax=Janthinobacterium sp. TaxID=1871054 RepID=UPI00261AB2D4|nr:GGDEF domain-containing protein [Janthinobacterium sp.]